MHPEATSTRPGTEVIPRRKSHSVPSQKRKPGRPSVWYTSKPVAGLVMAMRSASVMRGVSTPWVVEATSSTADVCGLVPAVLIPTPCPIASTLSSRAAEVVMRMDAVAFIGTVFLIVFNYFVVKPHIGERAVFVVARNLCRIGRHSAYIAPVEIIREKRGPRVSAKNFNIKIIHLGDSVSRKTGIELRRAVLADHDPHFSIS